MLIVRCFRAPPCPARQGRARPGDAAGFSECRVPLRRDRSHVRSQDHDSPRGGHGHRRYLESTLLRSRRNRALTFADSP